MIIIKDRGRWVDQRRQWRKKEVSLVNNVLILRRGIVEEEVRVSCVIAFPQISRWLEDRAFSC